MNRTELISIIAEKTEITKKDIEEILDLFSSTVADTLGKGEKVVVTGFGTFEVRERVGRTGRNPRTGETLTIPPLKTPAFKAGKSLKEAVR